MLFLFDEPASNLHPTAQAALLSSLEALSKDAVVIYATHSHHLINPTWLETTFVVANHGLDPAALSANFTAGRTDIHITPYRQFAAKHPDQSHYFQPILDVLDYSPSDLEMVPEVAMVEGKSDFYLLAYYERVFLETHKDAALRYLPGGGAGTMDDVIQLYIAWATPFVVLLDSDAAGDRQATRYSEKFGAIVEARIVQVAEASGKRQAKNLEELLTKTDHLKFQRIVDETSSTYNKKTFSRGVQEALVGKHQIDLTKTAQAVLGRTVQTLRERIAAQSA